MSVTELQNHSLSAGQTAIQGDSQTASGSGPTEPKQGLDLKRLRLVVTGTVQGVGFRPFVYRLAHANRLSGKVHNTPEGVEIVVQGPESGIQAFRSGLVHDCPPVAGITGLEAEALPPEPDEGAFTIVPSAQGQGHRVLISPDIATCDQCVQDITDPDNPRFHYPFTNCTSCGPRYTITTSIPYDRPSTSMACFPMCPDCSLEYEDPANRRFHAQPNACPVCGPRVWLADSEGSLLCTSRDALDHAAGDLAKGMILALKGLGGFHLACRATHGQAVQELRTRKGRWGKPLALMVPDLETAQKIAEVSRGAADWLAGTVRPIVLVPKKPGSSLAKAVSPDTSTVGLMLPYTPLHHILLDLYRNHLCTHDLPALVMTSGNFSSEPIALGNREALGRLGPLVDRFLFHNRDILVRTDDSVLGVLPDTEQTLMFRRARGFTPSPIELGRSGPCVLGLGPELKSTICLTKGSQAFPSQHIGDLQNLETFEFFQETIRHLAAILQVEPALMVADLHPDFMSTRYAVDQDKLPVLRLQHHFAHVHAVLAENRHLGPALGMILDGTGLGLDGNVWGGELLRVDSRTNDHQRLGHFARVPMPGGEKAIEEPWRMAQAFLHALGHKRPHARAWPWLPDQAGASHLAGQMLDKGISCLPTTSCGRLFDAVSALLGLCQRIEYEGQAAIMLEAIQDLTEDRGYPCPVRDEDGLIFLDTLALFSAAHQDWEDNVQSGRISRRFHLGLAQGLRNWALAARKKTGISQIALSGGVFQNQTLNQALQQELTAAGLTPLSHLHLPPNDACISLGQAAFGLQHLLLESS